MMRTTTYVLILLFVERVFPKEAPTILQNCSTCEVNPARTPEEFAAARQNARDCDETRLGILRQAQKVLSAASKASDDKGVLLRKDLDSLLEHKSSHDLIDKKRQEDAKDREEQQRELDKVVKPKEGPAPLNEVATDFANRKVDEKFNSGNKPPSGSYVKVNGPTRYYKIENDSTYVTEDGRVIDLMDNISQGRIDPKMLIGDFGVNTNENGEIQEGQVLVVGGGEDPVKKTDENSSSFKNSHYLIHPDGRISFIGASFTDGEIFNPDKDVLDGKVGDSNPNDHFDRSFSPPVLKTGRKFNTNSPSNSEIGQNEDAEKLSYFGMLKKAFSRGWDATPFNVGKSNDSADSDNEDDGMGLSDRS